MTERVFCIKRSSLNEIFDRFLDNKDYAFLPRKTKNREDDVEYSRDYIQLIPYVRVILTGSESNKLIAYRRSGTMSGEKRLEGTWSIGFFFGRYTNTRNRENFAHHFSVDVNTFFDGFIVHVKSNDHLFL